MNRRLWVLAALCLLWVVSQAWAMDAPRVTTPTQGAALGPNYDVLGSMPHKAFLIVLTDVVTQKGVLLRTVPGIRHWTAADGTFHFRVASPRVSIGEKETKVQYRVRVFESSQQGKGPETVINCEMAE
jgi:hypothetical protein